MNDTADSAPHRAPDRGPSWRPLVRRVLGFVALFAALQFGWESARGTWLERAWIHDLTVRTATALINQITPAAQAVAQGSRINAPGGGLNVLFGCEGTDVVFMLAAAFAVFPMPMRRRLWGMAGGLLWVFALNQLRIAALFYAYRSDREWFDLLHNLAAPLAMVALTGGFFQLWVMAAERRSALAGEALASPSQV